MPPAPTADEDLSSKPAAQIAFREAYYSGYGPATAVNRSYERSAQRYRNLYYRLHAEVDKHIDRVRRAVTEVGSENAVLVRTSDHGDLLGAHGGPHQKWFNLYDEATRVPFVIVRTGENATTQRTVSAPTSHTSRPTIGGPTLICTSCGSICACSSSGYGRRLRRSAINRGRMPIGSRQPAPRRA